MFLVAGGDPAILSLLVTIPWTSRGKPYPPLLAGHFFLRRMTLDGPIRVIRSLANRHNPTPWPEWSDMGAWLVRAEWSGI